MMCTTTRKDMIGVTHGVDFTTTCQILRCRSTDVTDELALRFILAGRTCVEYRTLQVPVRYLEKLKLVQPPIRGHAERINFRLTFPCSCCGDAPETLDHLFYDCTCFAALRNDSLVDWARQQPPATRHCGYGLLVHVHEKAKVFALQKMMVSIFKAKSEYWHEHMTPVKLLDADPTPARAFDQHRGVLRVVALALNMKRSNPTRMKLLFKFAPDIAKLETLNRTTKQQLAATKRKAQAEIERELDHTQKRSRISPLRFSDNVNVDQQPRQKRTHEFKDSMGHHKVRRLDVQPLASQCKRASRVRKAEGDVQAEHAHQHMPCKRHKSLHERLEIITEPWPPPLPAKRRRLSA